MIISVEEARQLIGKAASKKYADSQIEELVNVLSAIANLAIDSYIEMKRERAEKRNVTKPQKGGDLLG